MPIEDPPPFTTNASQPVKIVSGQEPWTEYWLEDGTCIRARLRVQGFQRFDGHFDSEGRPVYAHAHLIDFVIENVAPELMRGAPPPAKLDS